MSVRISPRLQKINTFVQRVLHFPMQPHHGTFLIGGHHPPPKIMLHVRHRGISEQLDIVLEDRLGADGGGPDILLGHKLAREAHSGLDLVHEGHLGLHHNFEVVLQGAEEEASSPVVVVGVVGPAGGTADVALAVEEEGDDVWIALGYQKELAVEHFCKTRYWYILHDGPIVIGLILLPALLPHDSIGIFNHQGDSINKAWHSRTGQSGTPDDHIRRGNIIQEHRRGLLGGRRQRDAKHPPRLPIGFLEGHVPAGEEPNDIPPMVPIEQDPLLIQPPQTHRPGILKTGDERRDDLRREDLGQFLIGATADRRADDGPRRGAGDDAGQDLRLQEAPDDAEVVHSHARPAGEDQGGAAVGSAGAAEEME
mmetsp:Transcript_186/g.401  ORF Transcript_186/g.401 Transcript_186/m.401 type:complete len:367 (+) Transcript_186:163-1263(+)